MGKQPFGCIILTGIIIVMRATAVYGQFVEPHQVFIPEAEFAGNICTLDPTDINANFYFAPHRHITFDEVQKRQATSTFDVTYVNNCGENDWPEEAKSAFQYAADIWSLHLSSPVPIRVEAIWQAQSGNVLGSASPSLFFAFTQHEIDEYFGEGYHANTYYPIAQASAVTGVDYVNSYDYVSSDMVININCNFSGWYFGTDGNPLVSRIDLVSVVMHEIGHGLGFIGSMRETGQNVASWGLSSNPALPIAYDRFALDGSFEYLIDEEMYGNDSADLHQAVTGHRGGVFFGGGESEFGNHYNRVKLYSPSTYQPGSSFSHLDQQTFSRTENALMRPRIDRQFAIHSPGPVFCGMLKDMGWPLGSACRFLLEDPSNSPKPELVQPANGAKNQLLAPVLAWAGDAGETYIVEVSTDFGHSQTIVSEMAAGNEVVLPPVLSFETLYFWRVKSETSSWSHTSWFTTMEGTPDSVALLSPEHGAENVLVDVELHWTPAAGAGQYRVQVSEDSDFGTMVVNQIVSSTRLPMAEMLDYSNTYYWRVRAENKENLSEWSPVFSFITIEERPETVVLETPQHGQEQISVQPELRWQESARALDYQVQVSEDSGFEQVIVNRETTAIRFSLPLVLEHYKTYYWRVRAKNDGGASEWSHIFSFTTIIERPETVVMEAPQHGQGQVPIHPELSWRESARASGYQVQVSGDLNFDTVIMDANTTETFFTGNIPLEFATFYYWRVKASNIGGESNWSEPREFITEVRETKIFPNYPNPFSSSTTVKYQLSEMRAVAIELYDISGRRVAVLVNEEQPAGVYFLPYNAGGLASGVYLLRFIAGDLTDIQKISVIK